MDTFSTFAAGWQSLYVLHAVECAAFALLIWSCDKLFRLSTSTRYWLWLLGLVKFFLPPLVRLPVALSLEMPVLLVTLAPVAASSEALASQPAFALAKILFCLWAISVALLAGYIIVQNFLLRRRLRAARSITAKLQHRIATARLATVQLHESTVIQSPLLTGVTSPRLYLPADWQQ